jgi:hypothetical protein
VNVLQQHLEDLAPTARIEQLATDLAGRSAIESDRQAQYVSLRPSMEGAVAVYLHKNWVSLALPPERALEVIGQLPGATLDKKTPATTYVHISDEVLEERYDVAVQVAGEAVSWRATGPRSSVGTGSTKSPAKQIGSCPVHHLQLLPSGACPDCGRTP